MSVYVDASAAVKLLAHEAESSALARYLESASVTDRPVMSSILLDTELRRAAVRLGFSQASATAVLDGIDLIGITRSMYTEAGLLGGRSLRALDALHVVGALRAHAEDFVSYDARQIEAARGAGLRVASPS